MHTRTYNLIQSFGKLSLKKDFCSSTERVLLFFCQTGRVTPTTLFLCVSRGAFMERKICTELVIGHRNKTSCAYIRLQSGVHGKSYIQKCKNENHMQCFTHLSRNPQLALYAVLLMQNSAVGKKSNWRRGKEITERKKKALTSLLNKPFLDPKTKVITPINKPFVQALSDQENLPACKQHTDKQVQGYQPM